MVKVNDEYIANQFNTILNQFNNQSTEFKKQSAESKEQISQLKSINEKFQQISDKRIDELEGQIIELKSELNIISQNTENLLHGTSSATDILTDITKQVSENSDKLLHNLSNQLEQINHNVSENSDKLLVNQAAQFDLILPKIKDTLSASLTGLLDKNFKTIITMISVLKETSLSSDDFKSLVNNKLGEVSEQTSEFIEMTRAQYQTLIATTTESNKSTTAGPISDRISADLDEVKTLIQFFRRSPTDKQECLSEVRRTQDTIIFDRDTEAPYRATATNTFRGILNELSREGKAIQRATNRSIIHQLDQLLDYIHMNS